MPLAPLDETITIPQLVNRPYAVYKRLRAQAPVMRVAAVKRTFLTKAADTQAVKANPAVFSSNDPNTPMERAFRAHTLMRKDGEAHQAERMAMQPAYSGKIIKQCWEPLYRQIAEDFVTSLPRGQTVDLFTVLAGPFAARCLTHLLGITAATDDQMQLWSQTLIDGAGNFGWDPALFAQTDTVNDAIDTCIDAAMIQHKAAPNPSVLSAMTNTDAPLPLSQIRSNIKIAIGGGINEPRDAMMTLIYGLLSNPDQFAAAKADALWGTAFDEAVRWVAPIQVSSRLVVEDTQIRGLDIPKGHVVMTIQASANHDEDLWADGHLYDIFRPKQSHQAFGNGPHFCQGMHIARRMLADIMLPMLFDRFPNMSLAGEVDFTGFGFRGPASLPVCLA